MKIALINGSPKKIKSTSNILLEALEKTLENDLVITTKHHFNKPTLQIDEMTALAASDALVFAFPLYVDSLPSHFLSCLMLLDNFFVDHGNRDLSVYSLVNCGFYEGTQNKIALEIIENWCIKSGLNWGQGIGIGGGPISSSLNNLTSGHDSRKNLNLAIAQITSNILNQSSGDNIFISPNLPRLVYKMAVEANWRRAIKAHGLKRKDLSLKK